MLLNKSAATPRKLGFQSLEDRSMMAGDVQVFVQANTMYVCGDNADNNIVITQAGAGAFRVTGINTTVNHSSKSFVAQGVTGDAWVFLYGGSDILQIAKASFGGNLEINMSGGKDIVSLAAVHVKGSASIDTAPNIEIPPGVDGKIVPTPTTYDAGDVISIANCSFGQAISGDYGTDAQSVSSYQSSSHMSLHIDTGDYADIIAVGLVKATGAIDIDTFGGKDIVALANVRSKSLYVDLGAGKDTLTLALVSAGYASLDGGAASGNTLVNAATSFGSSKIKNF